MSSIQRILPSLVAGALLGACAPDPADGGPPAPHAAYRGPLASSLQVETLGDSARLVLRVTNASGAPVQLTFPSGQTYDFVVRDGGAVLWSWGADRMFTQAVRTETLGPGETRTYAETWRVDAGRRGRTLTAAARLTSSDHPIEQSAEFRLP